MLAEITEALRRGDTAAALAAARAAVAAHPADASTQHLLGVCLQRQGDPAGARAAFERAVELAPDHADARFSLAGQVLSEGDVARAIEGLEHVIALDPNQLGAYVMLVHLAAARGDLAAAEARFKLARRVNPDHPQVKLAEGYVAQARGDADAALRCFTAAATADPRLAAAQLALGMAYLGKGMWTFAEQALANALALEPALPPNALRALAEARRRQGKAAETLEALDPLITRQPDDPAARILRAEILADLGQGDAALADWLALLDRQPGHGPSLRRAVALLASSGRLDEARARAEAALAQQPQQDELWLLRLNLSGGADEDARAVLDRWLAAAPASALALDLLAAYHETRGDLDEAEAAADRALALDPTLHGANLIKARGEQARDPALALARLEAMLPRTADPMAQRAVHAGSALVLDALGRYDEAGAHLREMCKRLLPQRLLPPPPYPAEGAPAGRCDGLLLWVPPGVPAEFLLRRVQGALGPRLRVDRLGSTLGDDGFGRLRVAPGQPDAGSADRWRASLEEAGRDPATTVDWLPHLDAYTLAALDGARWLVLLTDPRDALLHWMVDGSLQDYLFSNEPLRSAEWLAASLGALADHREAHPDRATLVRLDLDADRAEAMIGQVLGLPQPLPAPSGIGQRFPHGHWKHYRGAFAAEFALLAPVAARLGYPDGG